MGGEFQRATRVIEGLFARAKRTIHDATSESSAAQRLEELLRQNSEQQTPSPFDGAKLPPIPTPTKASDTTPQPQPNTAAMDAIREATFNKVAFDVKNQMLNQLLANGLISTERARSLMLVNDSDKVLELLKGLNDLIASGAKSSKQPQVEGFPELKIDKDLVGLCEKILLKTPPSETLDDIKGQDEAIRELRGMSIQIKDPTSAKRFGLNTTKGFLLCGPGGVGKTMSVKGLANEVSCPMLIVTASEIFGSLVGQSEQNARNVFKLARQVAASHPSGKCIIFFDEIDSIAPRRDSNVHEVTQGVVNIILNELDGLKADNSIIVIGATNRAHAVDGAFLSRLERKIEFVLPNEEVRIAIIKSDFEKRAKLADRKLLAQRIDWKKIGEATINWGGRELKKVAEAALKAKWWASEVEKEKDVGNVSTKDMIDVIDTLNPSVLQSLVNQGLKNEAIALMQQWELRKQASANGKVGDAPAAEKDKLASAG